MEAYKCFLANCPEEKFIRGMEFDCDSSGKLIRMEQDIANIDLKLGAVHYLIGDTAKQASSEFMHITERLILSGIDILAHPFRIFQRRYLPEPTYLYEDIASLLAESQVAVELNFHTNRPEAEFFNVCLARGVKIALGSDAHNLYEVGDLRPHLEFLNTLSSTNVMEQLWHPNGRR
jgi:histidinol phosphatase-like PHP family hydrolase